MSHPTFRYLLGMSCAAALFLGCQDLLNNTDKQGNVTVTTDDGSTGSLSLSIKDDSSCREQWRSILDARSAGHADSAAEMAFLGACVKEVKVTKDMPKPVIPPALLPDSGTRCKWIVAQIEGGRDSLTVSYKKYCPEDCRMLEIHDSAGHERLCHDPIKDPIKPRDTVVVRPKDPVDDTCRMLAEKLSLVKPGEPGRADLEHMYAARSCPAPLPKPLPDPNADTCRMIRERLATLVAGSEEYAKWKQVYVERKCGDVIPPKDTLIVKPPMPNCDSLRKVLAGLPAGSADAIHLAGTIKEHCPEKPPVVPPRDSICMDLKLRMSAATSDAQRAELEAAFKLKCMDPIPPKDTVIVKPPMPNCDSLRKVLAGLPAGSADAIRLAGTIKEHCPEKPPVIIDTVKPPVLIPHDSICLDLKLRLSKATTDAQRAELEAAYKAKCTEPVPVVPPVTVNCDELRAKLAGLDPASADAIRIAGSIKEHCPDAPVVK